MLNKNSISPFVVRPVEENDLSVISDLASKEEPGLSLPYNKEAIAQKIQASIESFALEEDFNHLQNSKGFYFFVLENSITNEIVGTAALEACASRQKPFYNFLIGHIPQIIYEGTQEQKISRKVLFFGNHYQEATLLGTLFLDEKVRGLGLGQLLSRARCLFIAEFQNFFSELLIANMRGVFDKQGNSPFWNAIGQKIFNQPFDKFYHDYLTRHLHHRYVTPFYPIYVDLLPKDAQAVLGQVHDNTKPALHLLEKEGFMYREAVDIFDGGPVIEVPKKYLKSLQESRVAALKDFRSIQTGEGSCQKALVSNRKKDFRAILTHIEIESDGTVVLDPNAAKLLKIQYDDEIRYCPLKQ